MADATADTFDVELSIGKRLITLKGMLDCSENSREILERAFRAVAHIGGRWIVGELEWTLLQEERELWEKMVGEYLGHCHLHYLDSQLALCLQLDETYPHPHSTYARGILE